MDPEIAAALVGPVITAGLAASAVGLREWRARRESQDRREGALDQAIKEVAFIDAWVTAQSKLVDGPERREVTARARIDLDRAYEVMTAVRAEELATPKRRSTVDRLRSVLLLNVTRNGAKVVRVFYILFAVFGVLFVGVGTSNGFQFDTPQESIWLTILVAMFFTLFSFAPAIALYWIARLLDRPRRDPARTTPPTAPAYPAPPFGYPPPGYGSYADAPPPAHRYPPSR